MLIFIKSPGKHVANINWALKGVKSDNFIDFIHSDYQSLIVNSNKITSLSDVLVVETYIKNLNSMNASDVQSTQLSQSKSYLKILSIPYLIEGTNTSIDANIMKTVLF